MANPPSFKTGREFRKYIYDLHEYVNDQLNVPKHNRPTFEQIDIAFSPAVFWDPSSLPGGGYSRIRREDEPDNSFQVFPISCHNLTIF